MAIIRRSIRPSHYTVIDNLVLQDKRMSWKGQGLLTYLLSLPDSWQINIKHLARERPDGKDSTLSGLKELKTLGYLKKICVRDDRGRVLRWETQVFDLPQLTEDNDPETQKPRNRETQILDNPHSGEPGRIDITYSNKDLDQKETTAAKPGFSFSGNSNFSDPENLEIQDPDKNQNQNLIPDQQEKNQSDPEKKESSAKERKSAAPDFAPIAPENVPLARDGGRWDVNHLNKIWEANKAQKWRRSSLLLLTSEIQYGLEQFLFEAGGDRAEAYRLIGISIAEMAKDEFYGSRSRMLGEVIGLDASKPCKTYCGNWLGAAIEREEKALKKAQQPQSVERSPMPLPISNANNVFFTQIEDLIK